MALAEVSASQLNAEQLPEADCPFAAALRRAGVQLAPDAKAGASAGVRSEVTARQVSVRLATELPPNDARTEAFEQAMFAHIERPGALARLLRPLVVPADQRQSGDSLVAALLRVDSLQPRLVSHLLETLATAEAAGAEAAATTSAVLSQLRWLDYVVEQSQLTEKLLTVLQVCPPALQREIIGFVPELSGDGELHDVVTALQDLADQDDSLTVAVLDTLSNLDLTEDLKQAVTLRVLEMLPSARLSHLPVVVRFLLHSACAASLPEVVAEMRSALDVNALENAENEDMAAGEFLLVEALRSGLRFRDEAATVLLKLLQTVDGAADHTPLDLWALFCLCGVPHHAKRVQTLLTRKIRDGVVTDRLLADALVGHASALRSLVPSLLDLAHSLLRASGAAARRWGGALYGHLFTGATDGHQRQEVVARLVGHAGSGALAEVDEAFAVLRQLSKDPASCRALSGLSGFLKQLLDYVSALRPRHVRALFSVLCAICDDASDEVHIVIRKHLQQHDPEVKRIGVIGAIAFAIQQDQRSCSADEETLVESQDGPQSSPSGHSPNDYARAVTDTMALLTRSVESQPRYEEILYAELLEALQVAEAAGAPRGVLSYVSENYISLVQDRFLLHLTESAPQELVAGARALPLGGIVATEPRFNIDGGNAGFVVAVANLVASGDADEADRLRTLCPLVRLLVIGERMANSSIEELDGLLGCPVLYPAAQHWDEFATFSYPLQQQMCLVLFHTVNWLREMVGAFVRELSVWTRAKVLSRLYMLEQMETDLNVLARQCAFVAPGADVPAAAAAAPTPGGGVSEDDEEDEEEDDAAPKKGGKKAKAKKSKASSDKAQDRLAGAVAAALTPMAPQVACALSYGAYNLPGEDEGSVGGVVAVTCPLLATLLRELQRHLQASLAPKKATPWAPAPQQPAGRPPMELLRLYAPTVIPSLKGHAVALAAAMRAGEDAPAPAPTAVTADGDPRDWAQCLQMVVRCLALLCSCDALVEDPEARQLLRGAFVQYGADGDGEGDEPSQMSAAADVFAEAFDFCYALSDTLSSLDGAVNLLQLLSGLRRLSRVALEPEADPLGERISVLAWELLQRDWPDLKTAAPKLASVVKLRVTLAPEPLAVIAALAEETIPALSTTDGCRGPVDGVPTLTLPTMVHFLKPAMEALAGVFKTQLGVDADDAERSLATIEGALTTLQHFLKLSKHPEYERRAILVTSLKQGRSCVERFFELLPALEKLFAAHSQGMLGLLRKLQQCTRRLQVLCAHGKVTKDPSMTSQVPAVKRLLEKVLLRCRCFAAANQWLGEFTVANLKHKSLAGKDIVEEPSSGSDGSAGEESGGEESGGEVSGGEVEPAPEPEPELVDIVHDLEAGDEWGELGGNFVVSGGEEEAAAEEAAAEEEEEDEDERRRRRRREKRKKKKRRLSASSPEDEEEEEEEEEEDDAEEERRRRRKAKRKKQRRKRRSQLESSEEEEEEEVQSSASSSKSGKRRRKAAASMFEEEAMDDGDGEEEEIEEDDD